MNTNTVPARGWHMLVLLDDATSATAPDELFVRVPVVAWDVTPIAVSVRTRPSRARPVVPIDVPEEVSMRRWWLQAPDGSVLREADCYVDQDTLAHHVLTTLAELERRRAGDQT